MASSSEKAKNTIDDIFYALGAPIRLITDTVEDVGKAAGSVVKDVGGAAVDIGAKVSQNAVNTLNGVTTSAEDLITPDAQQQTSTMVFWVIIVAIVGVVGFMVYRAFSDKKGH